MADGSGRRLLVREKSSLGNGNGNTFLDSPLATVTKAAAASIKESMKSTILEEATREDSRLWQSNYTQQEQEQQHTQQKVVVNGHAHINGIQSQHPQRQQQQRLHFSGSVNRTTLSSEETSLSPLDDPLNDLYVSNASSRYWPDLPPSVKAVDQGQDTDGSGGISNDPFVLTKTELGNLSQSIREDLIGTDHPVLNRAASYFFEAAAEGGKKVRPMMVLLLSRALANAVSGCGEDGDDATQEQVAATEEEGKDAQSVFSSPLPWQRYDLPEAQRRLAEISEMIHTASLFHDDVIDGADTRRGVPTVHTIFGNKMAILAGDYLLARASICLARLRNEQVVETMSTIIEHLVRGEVMQMKGNASSSSSNGNNNNNTQHGTDRIVYYLRKNFYKTGSLMANSCRSAALLGDYPPELVSASYQYGKHVGMAFQLVDDCLDFEGSLASLGKPALADLQAGLATAPVLFAAQEEEQQQRQSHSDITTTTSTSATSLWSMVDRKFKQPGDVDLALERVMASSTAMQQTKELARFHAERAMDALLMAMPSSTPNRHRDALIRLAHKVVARTN